MDYYCIYMTDRIQARQQKADLTGFTRIEQAIEQLGPV